MPRNAQAEVGVVTALSGMTASWKEFANHVRRTEGSIRALHRKVRDAGYLIAEAPFYEQVKSIEDGAGLLQNPVLLNIVCRITGYDLNRAFGIGIYHSQSIAIPQDQIKLIADMTATQAVKALERERKSRLSPKPASGSPRTDWLPRLRGILISYGELTAPLYCPVPFLFEQSQDFARFCIQPFPQKSIFDIFDYERVLAKYTNTKLEGSGLWNEYLQVLVSFAVMAFLQTVRTIQVLADRPIKKGCKYTLAFQKSGLSIEFWEACDRLATLVTNLNGYLANEDNRLLSSPSLWNELSKLNWNVLWLWSSCFSGFTTARKWNLQDDSEIRGFMAEFLATAKKNRVPLVTINHLIINSTWLNIINQVIKQIERICEGIPESYKEQDMRDYKQLFKFPRLENQVGMMGTKSLPNP